MIVNLVCAGVAMILLMYLVYEQIEYADEDEYLTVEQMVRNKRRGISFDRHYAMPIDFCIIPGTVALSIVLCASQWQVWQVALSFLISIVFILFCMYVLWIGGNEAHVHDRKPTQAGWAHGIYAIIATALMFMVLVFTPAPNPVLLLILCIVVPAFLFVGQHMFLGMINKWGSASSFNGNYPLSNPVGWGVLICFTAIVWTRSYSLIPTAFWQSLQ